jgi:GH15 family glucan-1,4-alpha-glucosidase
MAAYALNRIRTSRYCSSMANEPAIRDLALIGDRRTVALQNREGSIVWYCPGRFDSPSLLAGLLDAEHGGTWTMDLADAKPAGRNYLADSGVLRTRLSCPAGGWTVTDFMPYGPDLPRGICRLFHAAPAEVHLNLQPAPDYARRSPKLELRHDAVVIDDAHVLYASHPLHIEGSTVCWTLPQGDQGWALLLDEAREDINRARIERWLEQTLDAWRELASHATYHGPFETQVADSLRALRLLTFEENGGIVAAPTTSLPEVMGGHRNYDYRYV